MILHRPNRSHIRERLLSEAHSIITLDFFLQSYFSFLLSLFFAWSRSTGSVKFDLSVRSVQSRNAFFRPITISAIGEGRKPHVLPERSTICMLGWLAAWSLYVWATQSFMGHNTGWSCQEPQMGKSQLIRYWGNTQHNKSYFYEKVLPD